MASLFGIEKASIGKAVKNLNARLSRAYKNKGDKVQDILNEMVSTLPTTKRFLIKRGDKLIKDMSDSEYRDYVAQLESITSFLNAKKVLNKLEEGNFQGKDLWTIMDIAREKGTVPDSGTVKALVDSLTENPNEKAFTRAIADILEVATGKKGVIEFEDYWAESWEIM